MAPTRTLVTGGSSSGKSRYAESLLARERRVTYVAPGYVPDPARDPEWAARIAAHRLRRPAHWTTAETVDVVAALRGSDGPLLLDCLGTWLTRYVDGLGTWDVPLERWRSRFEAQAAELVAAWRAVPGPAVAVTNEVGWGVVPEHRSGRVFTDLLGHLNVAMSQASDEVVLVVAGRPLRL
jgi:adenosylcobinamide kinase / adenosylcobinamide-phosphate guanylyltransferase